MHLSSYCPRAQIWVSDVISVHVCVSVFIELGARWSEIAAPECVENADGCCFCFFRQTCVTFYTKITGRSLIPRTPPPPKKQPGLAAQTEDFLPSSCLIEQYQQPLLLCLHQAFCFGIIEPFLIKTGPWQTGNKRSALKYDEGFLVVFAWTCMFLHSDVTCCFCHPTCVDIVIKSYVWLSTWV